MDKYIIGENSSGKTRRMLEAAKKDGAVVVCKNPYAMERKADNYGIFGVEFIGYDDLDAHILNGDKIAVDEIGNFFEHCYGVKLDAFTMTVE